MTTAPHGIDLFAPIIIFVLTGTLTAVFTYKRKTTNVHALDWLIAIFGSTALLGAVQILKLYFINKWPIFVNDNVPRSLDIITVINLFTLIIIYFMAESFLAERPNPIRLVLMTIGVTMFFSFALYYLGTGDIVRTSDILPFADPTTFDSFLFDLIQVCVIGLLLYVFILQFRLSDNKTIRQYLLIIILAIALYFGVSLLELREHFGNFVNISAFESAIPTFVLLAYFYLRHPNFVYLAPAKIAFLQIVSKDGQLLYAAELTDELNTSDFLVGPSLTSVGSIISELVDTGSKRVTLKQFVYNGGYILFETIDNLIAILQTDRPSQILKRSMRYFLREFHAHFSDQVKNFKGYIEDVDGLSPDDIFITAIPIVQSKVMSSHFPTSQSS